MNRKLRHARILFIANIAVELFDHCLELLLERLFLGCFDGPLFFDLGRFHYFHI